MLVYSLIFMMLYACAHKGSLSGGKKDTIPPKVLETDPPNGSTHFEGNRFSIEFDEFIQLENINQKALISPPVEEAPDYVLRGKSLVVKFNEELKANTTYSVYFGDAIVDLTEGNPILNYTYIFSTGAFVDSLSIHGEAYNAFDLTPVEETYIMLYLDNNDSLPLDSLPYFVKPYYISKTDVNGHFTLKGLSDNRYLCFALKDLNSSYTYDQPSEEIAFLDSLIQPEYIETKKDTVINDSLLALMDSTKLEMTILDSIAADSVISDSMAWEMQAGTMYELFMFQEADTSQKFLKADVIRKDVIQFSFARDAKHVDFIPQNDTLKIDYLLKQSADNDTLTWFLRDYPIDTLELMLMLQQDTLDELYIKVDPRKKTRREERRKEKDKEKKEVKEYLKMSSNINGGNLKLNKKLRLSFDYPIVSTYTDSLLLVLGTDSIYNPDFQYTDSLFMDVVFPGELVEETQYVLVIPDSTFTNWNGNHNDEIAYSFSTHPFKYYGILTMRIVPEVEQNYVLQMMTENEELVNEVVFTSDTSILYEYIEPSKYLFKLIYDDNANGAWDPGDFGSKRQAEKVRYLEKLIQVRGNWEIEESWYINEDDQ